MKTREPIYIGIILLLCGVIGYMVYQNKIQQEFAFARSAQFADAIEKARQTAQSYADSVHDLKVRLALRQHSDSVALSALINDLKAMSKKVVILRVPVELAADSIQPLRDYLVLADSLAQAKDSLIYDMGLRHSAQLLDLNQIIDLQAKQIMDLHAVQTTLEDRNKVLEANSVKDKRKIRTRDYIISGVVAFALMQFLVK